MEPPTNGPQISGVHKTLDGRFDIMVETFVKDGSGELTILENIGEMELIYTEVVEQVGNKRVEVIEKIG